MWLHPNAGQWDERIRWRAELNYGELYVENDGLLFNLSDAAHKAHASHEGESGSDSYHGHVIRATFLNSNWQGESETSDSSGFYRNYFIGNDPARWKSELRSVHQVSMKSFYPGIDLVYEGLERGLKYSFILQPGSDPTQIVTSYEGTDGIRVNEKGNLLIPTDFGTIIEEKPVAWNVINGKKKMVPAEFVVRDNRISYHFPEGYDSNQQLVIDPVLVFSSFTGSFSDNWGFTAAPDPQTNLVSGGIVFGSSYPTTTGAYDNSFNGGSSHISIAGFDVAISKFNASGTALIYSTFLGGSSNETPNSIVSAENGELFILGVTGSADFPIPTGGFDNTFGGGSAYIANELYFPQGTDIYIARLNQNGSALLASTYLGGAGNDGTNTECRFNYGDDYRGEIIVDDAGSVYIASSTNSVNFPVTSGQSAQGNQDAVICKLPVALNSLTWSSYFGGSGDDSGNALELNSTGQLYVAGGTKSTGLFTSGEDLSYNGGIMDGYVARFNASTGASMSGTYMGMNEFDQTYFVQIDLDDNVYVFGQTESNWPITPGHYGNPNSGQFIRKYNGALSSTLWTTMIGAGSGHAEISPTAFLVSDCYDIYFSGWGGLINVQFSDAVNSSSNGFPLTSDAYQSTTNGSNFYIAVLDHDAMNLKYATYFGGLSTSSNHVDGGTSRFDKQGRIYHAVCGACGGQDHGFTTTPGAFSETNNSTNCNMAVFKFKLNEIEAIVSTPNTIVCIPDPVIFDNNSANGNSFFWDFGDNTTSTLVNPTHFYTSPGNYEVTLIVSDTNNCFSSDTTVFDVDINDFQGGVVPPASTVCPGEDYQLEAFGGSHYAWSPGNVLDDSTSATPTATIFETTLFTVIISDTCGVDTVTVQLDVFQGISDISNDTSICIGNSVPLFVSGGTTYNWSPPDYLDDPTSATPVSTPDQTTNYVVTVTTADGCTLQETVNIQVFFTPPDPQMPDSIDLCYGTETDVTVSGAQNYYWNPNFYIFPLSGPTVSMNPPISTYYYCDFENACATVRDSMFVRVIRPHVTASPDTIVCPGTPVPLMANGANSYHWQPADYVVNPSGNPVVVKPVVPTEFIVSGTDNFGCTDHDTVFVDLFPKPFVQANPDVYAFPGDEVQLYATGGTSGNYVWSPGEFLTCVVCDQPLASPDQNFTYTVTYIDENGCRASDQTTIHYDAILYVPNTFTPGGNDGFNNLFRAEGGNIRTFEMRIFNRWGELICTLDSLDEYWDGTYNGLPCPDGTYVWKVVYTDFNDQKYMRTGHINLLR